MSSLYERIKARLPADHDAAATRRVCALLASHAREHVALQTERANGVRRSRAAHDHDVQIVEASLTRLAAELPGGPWRVEFQGRGGGLLVVLALVDAPDEGDGWGGGWNLGGGS